MAPPKSILWNYIQNLKKDIVECKFCLKIVELLKNTSNMMNCLNIKHPQMCSLHTKIVTPRKSVMVFSY